MRTPAHWIRPLLLMLLLVTLPAGVRAQGADTGKHCFWEVKGEEGTLYLLGSIHFLKKEFYPLDPVIEEAFERSGVVVFETDLEATQQPATQLKLAAAGMCPAGKSLKDYVSEETYAALKKRLEEDAGAVAVALFDRFQPWMAAMTLVVLELQKLGFNPEHGVDQYFHRKARQAEKRVEPLETLEFQMNLLTGLSQDDQDAFLQQTLSEVGQFKAMFESMTTAWKTGDTEALDKLIVDSMREHPEVLKLFLTDRNQRWVPKLEELMRGNKTVFVVVGAGHLVGTNSLVQLLQEKGLKARQL